MCLKHRMVNDICMRDSSIRIVNGSEKLNKSYMMVEATVSEDSLGSCWYVTLTLDLAERTIHLEFTEHNLPCLLYDVDDDGLEHACLLHLRSNYKLPPPS